MDRGVKIAIFLASVVSLGLGLIWDQVLSQARNVVQSQAADVLGPDVIEGRVGSPDLRRIETPPDDFDVQPPSDLAPETPIQASPASPATPGWTEHTVVRGDSWWRLAHSTYRERGLSSEDIQRANPGVSLRPDVVIRVPTTAGAILPPAGDTTPRPSPSPAPAPSTDPSGATEHVVQTGDSWWRLAYVIYRDRGLTTEDLQSANPGVNLRPGVTVRIPE